MPAIRRHVHIAAGPRAVWKALTTAEGLEGWLADGARVDPRKGGRFVLINEDDDGNPAEEHGVILCWRPTSHLEIAWDNVGSFESKGTQIAFRIAKDGSETRVALVHSGKLFDDDEDARKRVDREWKGALRSLRGMLESA